MRLSAPAFLLAALPAAAVLAVAWTLAFRRARTRKLMPALRTAAAVLLALAAAGLAWRSGGRPRALVILDRSASLGAARTRAAAAAEAAGQALASRYDVGYASFANSVRSENPDALASLAPDESGTDLDAALAFARGALAPGEPAVLVTDGRWTQNAPAWGERAPQLVLLPAGPPGADAALAEISAPTEARPGEKIAISVRVTGSASGPVKVTLTRTAPGALVEKINRPVELSLPNATPATRTAVFEDTFPDAGSGLIEYAATLSAEDDAEPANNAARALVRPAGPLRVGIISVKTSPAASALARTTLKLTTLKPNELPAELSPFGALILDDVPREALSDENRARLANYVRSGGGLLVLGGMNSYAQGGYDDSGDLEKALPASMRPPDEEGLFAVLVLDRSGSMGRPAAPGAEAKLALTRRAAKAVLEPLAGRDLLTVVAFAEKPEIAAGPARPETDAEVFRSAIDKLEAGGSTSISGALKFISAEVLPRAGETQARHVLLLSDGLPEAPDADPRKEIAAAEAAARAIADSGATLSTVYTGAASPDKKAAELLGRLAAIGRGDAYLPRDLEKLSDIFRRDILARREAKVLLGDFRAAATGDPLAARLPELPVMRGRNRVSARPEARTVLEAPAPGRRGREPLLLAWERGRGRAACFASEFGRDWGGEFTKRNATGPAFIESLIRWAAGRGGREGCRLALARDETGGLRLDLFVKNAGKDLIPAAELRDLAGEWTARAELVQESPSRWSALVTPPAGAREIIVRAASSGHDLARGAFPLDYPEELSRVGVDRDALENLARLTGGRVIDQPVELAGMEFRRAAGRGWTGAGPWLAAAALAMVMIDLALRALGR